MSGSAYQLATLISPAYNAAILGANTGMFRYWSSGGVYRLLAQTALSAAPAKPW